jgi:hypothetical protein
MAKKSSKVDITKVFRIKPKKNNKGIHSKKNKPEKAYRGQGRCR